MHTDHELGTLRPRGDFGDGDRARVRREDGARLRLTIQVGEDLELEIAILRYGLDDDRGIADGVHRRCGGHAAEDGVLIAGGKCALLDLTIEIRCYRRASAGERVAGDIDHRYRETALRENVGDSISHLTRPQHGDSFTCIHSLGSSCRRDFRRA